MPLNPALKKVLIIGSGPIVIGQAAEFDYAGSQACRALRSVGLEIVLVNSNPATIMTDAALADRVYIEPLTVETIKRIILKERPDGVLSNLGGQTGLTLSMQLAREGFLEEQGILLLGSKLDTIEKAEDRLLFKETMEKIHQPCVPSEVVTDVDAALAFAITVDYPVIVRPAYTLGGTGGGIAQNEHELREIASNGLRMSPITQILVEKCISGWKEIEFEVMRDKDGTAIAICSMENVDPVGVHTGDSIVVAPAVTLAEREYGMLKQAALDIVNELEVEGGCNCQFALHAESFEYAVIEVNPRVSRSSALASKATGYPIAKTAALLAVGYTLGEMRNPVAPSATSCFEPAIDYIVVKLPKWPFDKFVYARRTLGTQMMATGEVMSIAPGFEQAIMKAVRGAEINMDTLRLKTLADLTDGEVEKKLAEITDERLFVIYEALHRGISVDTIHEITMVDEWFICKLKNLVDCEVSLAKGPLTDELYKAAKRLGFLDATIEKLSGQKITNLLLPVYKTVDTCAGEFEAQAPYFYATYDQENEAAEFIAKRDPEKKRVMVFGSGPIRIGQGIEFDYASVHCVWTLKEMGYDVILVNNNPETVSTDFDTADRLYFEPLTFEDVMGVIATERPYGVVVAFGGQTAIKLTRKLHQAGVRILGTSPDSIDAAEDRERFDATLERLGIARPAGTAIMTAEEALTAANRLEYPVLLRPSYVLGGQNMIIAYNDADVQEYMRVILSHGIENPVLIDKYMSGLEVEVDVICDGVDVLLPGIMEHVERAGVHSGDSIAVYPAINLGGALTQRLVECSAALALAFDTRGLINIQYVIHQNEIYVIEANPRASRTVPYLSKVTGVPMVELAVRCMMGEKLAEMGFGTGLYRRSPYYAVKVPSFSFEKLIDADIHLGPEMKSTGEVLGIGRTLEEALYKGLVAAGYKMQHRGGVLISVRDTDKLDMIDTARKFVKLDCTLYATPGSAEALSAAGLDPIAVEPLGDDAAHAIRLIEGGEIQYVISTSSKGRIPSRGSVRLRRKAVDRGVPCLTSLDTANALADALGSRYSQQNMELVDITRLDSHKRKLNFVKMRGCGNDYIYFDCFEQEVMSPESLSVHVSNRATGIGGDGIILILPSDEADAKMRMFNADGTSGEVAGNALRCVGKYLYESGRVVKKEMTVLTGGGVKHLTLYVRDDEVYSVRVDMGMPIFEPSEIPVSLAGKHVLDREIELQGRTCRVSCVSMGNPHVVIFSPDVDREDVAGWGSRVERDPLFPKRVNVSFVTVLGGQALKMRVWERGIGETVACGTAACAAAVTAVRMGYCAKGADISIHVPGGELVVRYDERGVTLTGDATKDFEGVIEV